VRIAVSSDERTHLTDVVVEELDKRGHEVKLFGPLCGEDQDWPVVTRAAAEWVAQGKAEQGIFFCWTGTGASIAANKVPGIRAALCRDAYTAKGARTWNHANVLVLSLRAVSEAVAKEILDAWLETPYSDDDWNLLQMKRITELEDAY
jgi:ribose 5-phosphate isomerase B